MAKHFDVLVIGAGISGIGLGWYLQQHHPVKSYAILEARGATGGTWDLFRYPGIRSDSDLHTFGYAFKPWERDEAIARADAILEYVRSTATEHAIDRNILLHHKVLGARWSSARALWTVDVARTESGERFEMTCSWLFCAGGYYRYDEGFTPEFAGRERFKGPIIHPQHWPEGLDYAGKRVVVIGSGATAITLVPSMADKAAHVTMLQRTPSYVLSLPSEDDIANVLKRYLPKALAYDLTRRKNIALQRAIWLFCRTYPKAARRVIRRLNAKRLPKGYPVDEHFNPPYQPWDQRLCLVPNGDLFKAIRNGSVSVVTDHIETFTERGIQLKSGRELEADIIVTATGLNLQLFGGIALSVDGVKVSLPDKVVYKGVMLDGVPNFAFAIGYTNASWTLKVGLVCEFFCGLLAHMQANGLHICTPVGERGMKTMPIIDLGSGYVQRGLASIPRQGDRPPWQTTMSYYEDRELLRPDTIADPHLKFSARPAAAATTRTLDAPVVTGG